MIPIVHPLRIKTSIDISSISNVAKYINEGNILKLKDNPKNKFLILTLDNMVYEGLFNKTVINKIFSSNIIKYSQVAEMVDAITLNSYCNE
jgi:hypothetical protein